MDYRMHHGPKGQNRMIDRLTFAFLGDSVGFGLVDDTQAHLDAFSGLDLAVPARRGLLYGGAEEGRRWTRRDLDAAVIWTSYNILGMLRPKALGKRPEEAPQSTDGRPWGKLINGYCQSVTTSCIAPTGGMLNRAATVTSMDREGKKTDGNAL